MIGNVILFAGNYEPRGWAFCDGRELRILANINLFAVIGNTYGGDRKTTFALPDLRGRAVIGAGQGLSHYDLNDKGGTEAQTLNVKNVPAHQHAVKITLNIAGAATANMLSPVNGVYATNGDQPMFETSGNTFMAPYTGALVTSVVGSPNPQPVPVLHPVLAMNHIICVSEG
jgi:microcystin-dependent protein